MSSDRQRQAREIAHALRELLAASPAVQAAMGRRLGVPPGDVAAVDHVVSATAPIGPAELARRLDIRSASATTMVDRLETSGHLVREPHPDDRRRVVLRASDDGRREIGAALRPLVGAIEDLVDELSDDQADVVEQFLRRATEAMRDYARQDEAPRQPSRRPGTTKGSRDVREPNGSNG